MIARFDEVVQDKDKRYRPDIPREMQKETGKGKVLRFVEGCGVWVSARDKFLLEKVDK